MIKVKKSKTIHILSWLSIQIYLIKNAHDVKFINLQNLTEKKSDLCVTHLIKILLNLLSNNLRLFVNRTFPGIVLTLIPPNYTHRISTANNDVESLTFIGKLKVK